MSDFLGGITPNTVINAANAVASGSATNQPTVGSGALARPTTKQQAAGAIDKLLSAFGMSGSSLNKLRKAKIFQQLGLNGAGGGPVTKTAQQFLGMLRGLQGNQHATGAQKQHFAQLWLSTRGGRGARKALQSLSGQSRFFKSMDNNQREVVATKLGKQSSSAGVNRLKNAYASVVGNDFFHNARPQGKAQALQQPLRAEKTLKRWKAHQVKLPFDAKTCKKEAFQYARRHSGYRTLGGQMDLAAKLMSVRDRVLFKFFEDMPTQAAFKGKVQSYADFYLDQHLKGSSWAQGAHDYLRERGKQEKCGLFNGRGDHCL